MAENRKGKDKRFYFSRGQFLLLGCGFSVASMLVFFLGMLVGQGMEERKIVKPAEPAMRIPVRPAQGSNSAAGAKEEITFYDTLTRPAPAQARTEEETREAKKAEKSSKAESRENRLPARQEVTSVVKRAEDKPAPAAIKPRPAEADVKESRRPWTVQVNAFPDEKAAKTWVDRLQDKGYNAYLSESRIQGRVWYRVRVGRFESRDEAEKTQEALKRKENLTKAFATSR